MKKIIKSHFNKEEAFSMIKTFFAFLLVDAAVHIDALYQGILNGELTKGVIEAFALAVVRSFVKFCALSFKTWINKPSSHK